MDRDQRPIFSPVIRPSLGSALAIALLLAACGALLSWLGSSGG